ncbi:hypothetical protein [Vibrio splendidus]|nr:hypothetical protein [Vibrio splendidus]
MSTREIEILDCLNSLWGKIFGGALICMIGDDYPMPSAALN